VFREFLILGQVLTLGILNTVRFESQGTGRVVARYRGLGATRSVRVLALELHTNYLLGQRVNVRPGRARISLVPQGQARLVPFAKQLKLKPSSEEKRIKSSTLGNLSGLAISS
jgi:hypothetical protein